MSFARAEREYESRREDQATGEYDVLDTECCPECEGAILDDDGEPFKCPTCSGLGFVEIPEMTRQEYLGLLAEARGEI